jgi:Tol biopolymer transport system component
LSLQWSAVADGPPDLLIGFTQGRNDLPGGQFENWCTARAHVVRADGTGDRVVAAELARKPHSWTLFRGWSPDGEWLLFLSGQHYDCHPHVVRRDGTGLKKVAGRGGYRGVVETLVHPDFHSESSDTPVWGGDSRSIYYTAKVGESVELMQATLDGTVEQLTHSPPGTRHYHPAVSPDGGWLLFGSDRTGTMQLHVARIDGSDAAVVTAAPPGWSAMHGWWQRVSGATSPQ